MISMNLQPIIRVILEDYALPLEGDHGVAHWARVLENGEKLCTQTGAHNNIVALFAVLHDSRRINEIADPDHGMRAAEFATTIRRTLIGLDDHDFRLLCRACAGHTHERTHPDITIQTCWDADRLDLGRVGVTPHPRRLCTESAKHPDMIAWADGRARFRIVPNIVTESWGVCLP